MELTDAQSAKVQAQAKKCLNCGESSWRIRNEVGQYGGITTVVKGACTVSPRMVDFILSCTDCGTIQHVALPLIEVQENG